MLAARRGLGVEEERLAGPTFLAAVRWALYAEQLAPEVVSLRHVAETDPARQLLTAGGTALIEFRANRDKARATLKEIEAALFPPDAEEPADG